MANLWYIGMILAVFASMAGTIGKQLIRYAELQKLRKTRAGDIAARMTMVIALSLMTVIGPLIDMGSYAFAPQSLIAPLGALDVVWNTLLAPFTLGESLNRLLILGCFLIAAGAVATSLVGTHEDKTYTADEMKDMFIRWQVLAYLVVLFMFICFNIFVPMRLSAGPKGQAFVPGNKLRGLAIGMTAGSIAGNMFCVKGFVELVQLSIKDNDADVWTHWIPYAMLVGAIFFALSNLYFLSKGMKEYEALFMGSIFEGSLIFFACLSGGIVFKEFEVLKAFEFVIYCAALAGIVGGITAVAKGSSSPPPDDAKAAPPAAVHVDKVESESEPFSVPRSPAPISTDGLDELPELTRFTSKGSEMSGTESNRSATPSVRLSPFRGSGQFLFPLSISETIKDVQETTRRTSLSQVKPHGSPRGSPRGSTIDVKPVGKQSSTGAD